MAKKRILLCLYPFPPVGGPRSLRWMNLTKVLSEYGWKVDVLTAKPSAHDSFYDESLIRELPPDVKVFRTFPGIYYSLTHLKKRTARGFSKSTMEWLPFGLWKGYQLVKSQEYEAIVSSGLPFVGHLVGYFLERKSQIPWVADYGDPFTFNPMTSKLKHLLGNPVEKHILKDVAGMIVPLEEMRLEFLKFFPFLENVPTKEIGHGIPQNFEKIPPADFENKFVISYVGSLYKGDREPTQFFEALSSLSDNKELMGNIRVIIAGNTEQRYRDYASRLEIDAFIQFMGRIPYENSVSILKGSSAILLIGSKWSYHHFQYKVAECTVSRKPMIAIRQSTTDLGADFIKKYNLGYVVSNDKEEIAKAVETLFILWKNKNLENTFGHVAKENFSWLSRGKMLEEFLLSVIHKD
jgi:glycosyltransferase involved in cell wall biosynthesis